MPPYAVHPVYQPPSVSPLLSGWLQGLFWAISGFSIINGFAAIAQLNAYNTWRNASAGLDRIDALDTLDGIGLTRVGIGFFGSLISTAIFVLMIIWAFKASRTVNRLAPGERRWQPGWSIGAWFIPIAWFVLPKIVLNETEKIATAPRTEHGVVAGWPHTSPSGIGRAWWYSYVGFTLLGFFGSGRGATSYAISSLVQFGLAVAAVLGALYVRRLSERLSPRALSTLP